MPEPLFVPSFAVIPGRQVQQALAGWHREIVGVVESAYRAHGAGDTVNPPSYFLRFPDRPSSRIIALPASAAAPLRADGVKWISSFPGNVSAGIPRASAVLILNDYDTGYPFACLEASIISATRTAASAALAASRLSASPGGGRVGFFGTGLIARYVYDFLAATGWSFDEIGIFDLSPAHASAFAGYLRKAATSAPKITIRDTPEDLIRRSDLVVFATTAGEPHVTEAGWFSHCPLTLHLSLRDLSPGVILAASNVVDDVDHCLRANTSLHLTEQQTGHRDFVDGTLPDVLAGRARPAAGRPVIFSPFGLGVLDLAVGKFVYDTVRAAGDLTEVDGFFHDLERYG